MQTELDQLPIEIIRDHTRRAPVDVRALAEALGLRVREKDMGEDSGKI